MEAPTEGYRAAWAPMDTNGHEWSRMAAPTEGYRAAWTRMDTNGTEWCGLGDPTEHLFSTEGYRAAWTIMEPNGRYAKAQILQLIGIMMMAYPFILYGQLSR
jgi:hypothetical protein